MSFTHKHTRTWSKANASPVAFSKEIEEGVESNLDETVSAGSTDQVLVWTVPLTGLHMFFLGANVEIQVETNNPGGSSAAGDDDWTIPANQPIDWIENDVGDCPVSAAITQIYVSVPGDTDARVQGFALSDP